MWPADHRPLLGDEAKAIRLRESNGAANMARWSAWEEGVCRADRMYGVNDPLGLYAVLFAIATDAELAAARDRLLANAHDRYFRSALSRDPVLATGVRPSSTAQLAREQHYAQGLAGLVRRHRERERQMKGDGSPRVD